MTSLPNLLKTPSWPGKGISRQHGSSTVPVRKPARLASIAKRYRVSVAELKSWNKINGDTVKKGTILKVHVPYRSAAATTRARTKAIRAADVRTSRNTRASRVKVVMDAKNTASTKKGLVKSKTAALPEPLYRKKQNP